MKIVKSFSTLIFFFFLPIENTEEKCSDDDYDYNFDDSVVAKYLWNKQKKNDENSHLNIVYIFYSECS